MALFIFGGARHGPGTTQLPAALGLALGLAAGSSFVAQSIVNARLRTMLASPSWATWISYAGGTLVMSLILLARREGWPSPAAGPALAWTGGLFGAVYVMLMILLLPRLGAANVITLFLSGQMVPALVFDLFGLFGLARQPIDPARALGAVLLVAATELIRR